MKIPQGPPEWIPHFSKVVDYVAKEATGVSPTYKGRYLHWDELRFRKPPQGLTAEEWWAVIKFRRSSMMHRIPLSATNGQLFKYAVTSEMQAMLHQLDRDAAGKLLISEDGLPGDAREKYIIHSLRQEAISSSLLEGAATTRDQAKEMLRNGRRPRNDGERMVLNNYRAMAHIRKIVQEPLTAETVFQLHRTLTEGTLTQPDAAGRFRGPDERVEVVDAEGEVLHTPPPAGELPERMQQMCDFANGATPEEFLHPVLRAILLHFWLAYDHPFVDGNGRCARALFYWAMLRAGYWLFEFISISEILLEAPVQYGRAFLHTETDDNDCTYFLMHQLGVTQNAVERLQQYLREQVTEMRRVEGLVRHSGNFNHRQLDLLSHALRHTDARYTMESHGSSQGIGYATARQDLLQLEALGLLEKRKSGKAYYFLPSENLREKLGAI